VGAAMKISTAMSADNAICTVIISGEFDLAGVERVRQVLIEAIETDGIAHVVIDLGPTEFLDSSGIGVLVFAHNLAAHHGVALTLANASGLVEEVLKLTGVWQLFQPAPASGPQTAEPGGM
jgi:anti-sigma B factor antagonist